MRKARPIVPGVIEYQIYRFIVVFKVHNDGASPSIREIGSAVGVSSTSLISWYLLKLEKAGMVKRMENRRDFILPGGRYVFEGEA